MGMIAADRVFVVLENNDTLATTEIIEVIAAYLGGGHNA